MTNPATTTIDRCTPSQLKALLALAAERSGHDTSLPARVANRDELLRLLTEACDGAEESGEVLLATTCDEHTPLEALRGIKEMAKTLLAEAATEAHRTAATCLYHLALAAAFARYGVNISTRVLETRLALYEDLATALGDSLPGKVFREAIDRLLSQEEGGRKIPVIRPH